MTTTITDVEIDPSNLWSTLDLFYKRRLLRDILREDAEFTAEEDIVFKKPKTAGNKVLCKAGDTPDLWMLDSGKTDRVPESRVRESVEGIVTSAGPRRPRKIERHQLKDRAPKKRSIYRPRRWPTT